MFRARLPVGRLLRRCSIIFKRMSEPVDVFVSYTHRDKWGAEVVARALREEGFSVWWDDHLVPGRAFPRAIEEQLAKAACVVVLWSKSAATSDCLQSEAAAAAERNVLIPVCLDSTPLPLRLHLIQAIRCPDDVRLEESVLPNIVDAVRLMIASLPLGDVNVHTGRTAAGQGEIDVDEAIKAIVTTYLTNSRLALAPDIPIASLEMARIECRMSRSEHIIALFDMSITGSARNSICFTRTAMFVRDIASEALRIDYNEFRYCSFRKVGVWPLAVVELKPRVAISMLSMGVSRDELINALVAIRDWWGSPSA